MADSVVCLGAVTLLGILAQVAVTFTFDIHLTDRVSVGQVVFNASLGSSWRCDINPIRSSFSSGVEMVEVDSRGVITVTQPLSCLTVTQNPFTIQITCRDAAPQFRYTDIPVTVNIHGDDCELPNHALIYHSIKYTSSQDQQVVYIERTKDCLDIGYRIPLNEFIPLAILNTCKCHHTIHSSVWQHVPDSQEIMLAQDVCLEDGEMAVNLLGKCKCGDEHISWRFKIIIRSLTRWLSDFNLKAEEMKLSRLRRQAYMPPLFTQNSYVEHVAEDQSAGVVVGTFIITDSDTREVTYSLLATRDGRSQTMFAIDPNSGQVTTTESLDREGIAIHYFMVIATDNSNTRIEGQAALTIYVDDINDHAPEFESQSYSQVVSESLLVGATVITVRASDGDAGVNADIEYSILNPSGVNSVFQIDPRTGSITTRSQLDRETTQYYTLEIQASDKGAVPNRQTATAIVEIHIQDENDNYPQFTQSSYTVDVSEDIDPSGQPVIAEIRASDADTGNNAAIQYSITGGNSQGAFAIDGMSGQLSLLTHVDYEMGDSYRLSVRAQDEGSPPKSNSTTVLVRVTDVNDNTPRFLTSLFQEAVLESVSTGYTVMRIQAFDSDDGLNADLLYTIYDAQDFLPMVIDSHTGIITTDRLLDREAHAQYAFRVRAVDQGLPPRSATASVEVTVRDVNDNAPIFDPKVYYVRISEEAALGTLVETLNAVDNDESENARVTYAIDSGNARSTFNIISQMGEGLISLARPLNYREQSHYILTVTATDPGNLVDTATVFVNVSDANNYRPVFQGTPYQIRVDEDTVPGTSIFSVVATDGDIGQNAEITYTMDNNEVFQINSITGDITVRTALDREMTAGYTISVTAMDHGDDPKSDTTDVEIIVNDVNDNSPEFLKSSYSGLVEEGSITGTSVLTISAVDRDEGLNGHIRYTFEGGDNGGGDFTLDPTLGILRTDVILDRERTSSYQLIAFAVDRGVPERSTSVVINIEVEDINDNAPQFESSRISLEIAENSPIGTTVDSVLALDPDLGFNAEVDYSIVGGLDADAFALITRANEPAVITTLVEMDFETGKTSYSIIVRARSYHLFSDATVTINVVDVNDNMPQLSDFVIIFNNYEDHFPTTPIGSIPAFDPDVNDQLHYTFVSGNSAGILHLEENTGLIRLDSRLNSDVPTNATLQICVSDGINEVKAMCRLFVRMVTEEMLFNSITIRLHQIYQEAFLSPLYNRLISALASIIPTTEDNIFIINVQDDTDVPEQILNVSFSVRRAIEHNLDVFHPQQFLRERVYLQRALLARLSTLEVLPFDDNLCVREPCLNYEDCVLILSFGNASSFLSSDTMLFRPIHPINSVDCRCPEGFTGMTTEYLCDTEVNLCYSSPCGSNGSCMRHETGYTCLCDVGFAGDNCEFDMRNDQLDECPADVCRSSSHCSTLIRGGFRCESCPEDHSSGGSEFCVDCADLEYHTTFCDLTTRSFPQGSFLMFPSLKRRHRFNIKLGFSTQQSNALLFYNGRYNEMHDFIALEIIGGQIQFSFSLGTDITRIHAEIPGGVADGNWHTVTVDYLNRTATVSVDEWCDIAISILYGAQMGNYTCAGRGTQVLADRCAGITEPCHRFLDLTGPFQLGGLPGLPTEFQVQNTDFVGCIRDVYIDQDYLDLNGFAYNNGTVEGCPAKRAFCLSNPCLNGGTCHEAWGTYQCDCASNWGGIDCSQAIDAPRRLLGSSYLMFNPDSGFTTTPIQLPWYCGIAFRTRQQTSLLMSVMFDSDLNIHIKLVNGLIHFIYPEQSITFATSPVNDGQWHFLKVSWERGELLLDLDYRQVVQSTDVSGWVDGRSVSLVMVGGQVQYVGSVPLILSGFVGCVKDIRMGFSPNAILNNPQESNVQPGCELTDACENGDACPGDSYCNDEWGAATCTCKPGFIGHRCDDICTMWDPCINGECVSREDTIQGYECTNCTAGMFGQYCDEEDEEVCPATWWGSPVCGPCNCPVDRGFDAVCNKTTGECGCKFNHFQPEGSDTCYPCDCYTVGSFAQSCDPVTGQCPCRSAVMGRRCDSCSSMFAEVTLRGCEVVYDACPRSFASGIWWDRKSFGMTDIKDCPDGLQGEASRDCEFAGWSEPNLFNCTSPGFLDIAKKIRKLETGEEHISTANAKSLMTKTNLATNQSRVLMGMDVNLTYHAIKIVLKYENRQTGLNLTHTQDRSYIQNMVNSLGRVFEPQYLSAWNVIDNQFGSGGVAELLKLLEDYIHTLAMNMLITFTNPFDAVHENIVLGLDYAIKDDVSEITIPKYNNKVLNPAMFDRDTKAYIPTEILSEPTMRELVAELVDGVQPTASIGYILYRTLGSIMPREYADDVRLHESVLVSPNAPIFSLSVVDGNVTVHGRQEQPIRFNFRQLQSSNYSGPQCAYWKVTEAPAGVGGEWTTDGCDLTERYEINGEQFVTCECNHLSTFTVLMDETNIEYREDQTVAIVKYLLICLALLFLFVAFVIFCSLRALYSNVNTIHINLCLSIFFTYLIFIIGIDRTEHELLCTIVSIFLHFFFMCTFSWLFVETLHLYRMITEIQDINHGNMKFYYVVGYVVPGIIVGLAVGLSTDGYGNEYFCWLQTSNLLIWSFAGPIIITVLLTLIVFFMAVHASCRGKAAMDPEFSAYKDGLKAAIVLLPLLGMAWAFGLLAVNANFIAFHYLFAVSCLLQAIFIVLAYIVFNKKVRREVKYAIYRLQGKKGYEDAIGNTSTRSVLAYNHNDSSLDGGLNRMNIGISTSTTSRSTSKSSGAGGGMYRPDGYLTHPMSSQNTSPRGNGQPPPLYATVGGANPHIYGYNPHAMATNPMDDPDSNELHRRHRKRRDSDSDSDLSAVDNPDLDLASSHSSDDDDDPYSWGRMAKQKCPKNKVLERVRKQTPSKSGNSPKVPHSPTATAPLPYPFPNGHMTSSYGNWPGEGFSTTTASDTERKSPRPLQISDVQAVLDRNSPPYGILLRGNTSQEPLTPPERSDSLTLSSEGHPSHSHPKDRVQVLTHNGSLTESDPTTTSGTTTSGSGTGSEAWA